MAGSESFQIVSLRWMGQTELMSGSALGGTSLFHDVSQRRRCFASHVFAPKSKLDGLHVSEWLRGRWSAAYGR